MHDGRERLLSVEMRNLNAEYRAIPLIYIGMFQNPSLFTVLINSIKFISPVSRFNVATLILGCSVFARTAQIFSIGPNVRCFFFFFPFFVSQPRFDYNPGLEPRTALEKRFAEDLIKDKSEINDDVEHVHIQFRLMTVISSRLHSSQAVASVTDGDCAHCSSRHLQQYGEWRYSGRSCCYYSTVN